MRSAAGADRRLVPEPCSDECRRFARLSASAEIDAEVAAVLDREGRSTGLAARHVLIVEVTLFEPYLETPVSKYESSLWPLTATSTL
jgi:hypothetical protein